MSTPWPSKRRLLPLFALLLGTQACFNEKDLDFDRIAGVKVSPSIAIPLVHGTLAIEDLLPGEESEYIRYDEEQLIHILYSDTLYSSSIRELFLLPQLQLNKYYSAYLGSLANQEEYVIVKDRQELDFGFSEARFDEISLNKGTLSLAASSNVQADVHLQLSFPTLEKAGEPLNLSLTLPAGSTATQKLELDLRHYVADFTGYGTGHNVLPVDIKATVSTQNSTTLTNTANYVQLLLNIQELDFSLLKGYLGQPEVQLPTSQVPLTVFQNIFSKAEFNIKAPALSFDLLNSCGLPVQVQADVLHVGTENGEYLDLQLSPGNPFNINYPTQYNESAATRLEITNAGEAFALAPDFVDYRLRGRLNTGATEEVNFLTNESKLAVILHADVPLWGSLKELALTDTLNFPIQAEDAQVQEATIRTYVVNEFPLGADLQVYFLNEKEQVLDSLFDSSTPQIIQASQVNAQGDLSSPGEFSQDIVISSMRFERILRAHKIVIKGLLYTSRDADGSQPDVKIKANQRLNVNLGVKTNMNISVKL